MTIILLKFIFMKGEKLGEEKNEEILDAIELTPRELEYDDERETIEKRYADKKAELETAKLNLKNLSEYSYRELKNELIDTPNYANRIRGTQDKPNYSRVRLTEESGKEIIEIIENIEKETKENEEYRRKALKDALLKLTRSGALNQEK